MNTDNSIDGLVNNISTENQVRKSKNGVHSKILAAVLAGALSLTGAPAIYGDGADSTPTEQVVTIKGEEVNLSDYLKLNVEGSKGIDVYVSPIRREPKNSNNLLAIEKGYFRRWPKSAYFWDIIIHNTTEFGVLFDESRISYASAPNRIDVIEGEPLTRVYGRFFEDPVRLYIKPQGFVKFDDENSINPSNPPNETKGYTFIGVNDSKEPVRISYRIKIK